MSGPVEREHPSGLDEAQSAPPGRPSLHEHESDCARYLEDVRALVRRQNWEAGLVGRLSPQAWAPPLPRKTPLLVYPGRARGAWLGSPLRPRPAAPWPFPSSLAR